MLRRIRGGLLGIVEGYCMKGRTIVITSGKGGVGKTTTTANIGTSIAMSVHMVFVIDTDI